MAYYKLQLRDDNCIAPHCNKRATHRVHGHRNESFGVFCSQHADAKIRALQGYEKKVSELNQHSTGEGK